MDNINSARTVLNKIGLYSDIVGLVLDYIRDNKAYWARNNFKYVLKNVEEWGRLDEKKRITWHAEGRHDATPSHSIRESIDYHISTFLDYENFDEVIYDIDHTKKQLCSTCSKMRWLYEFEGGCITCWGCRKRQRSRRFKKKIIKQLDEMREYVDMVEKFERTHGIPRQPAQFIIKHPVAFGFYDVRYILQNSYTFEAAFIDIIYKNPRQSLIVYIPC